MLRMLILMLLIQNVSFGQMTYEEKREQRIQDENNRKVEILLKEVKEVKSSMDTVSNFHQSKDYFKEKFKVLDFHLSYGWGLIWNDSRLVGIPKQVDSLKKTFATKLFEIDSVLYLNQYNVFIKSVEDNDNKLSDEIYYGLRYSENTYYESKMPCLECLERINGDALKIIYATYDSTEIDKTLENLNQLKELQTKWMSITNYKKASIENEIQRLGSLHKSMYCNSKLSIIKDYIKKIKKYGDDFSINLNTFSCNSCSDSITDSRSKYLDSILVKVRKEEIASRERHNIPPIEVVNGSIYYSELGFPYLKLIVKNIDILPVDVIEAQLQAYNRFNEPVNDIFYQSNKSRILMQETINPDEEGGYRTSYLISLNSNVGRLKVVILRVGSRDGLVWKPRPKQQFAFWVNSPR